MPDRLAPPSQETVEKARLLYDGGVAPLPDIRALLGMSESSFLRFRKLNGWPMRASPIPGAAPAARADTRVLIARLEDTVEREFARAETALKKHAPKTSEQSARTLALLVKTLAELKRMRRDCDGDAAQAREDDAERHGFADDPPRELAELRAELARRLERLRGEGKAG